MVRRKRDGRVAIELDLVHAGVVTEAVLQTRTLLTGSAAGPGSTESGADSPPGGAEASAAASVDEEFAAIVAGLSPAGGEEDDAATADDPALRRLLPDAHLDDPVASAEFRRLSADSVRGRKVAAMDVVLADLAELRRQTGGVVLEPARVRSWLTALNDARLALGARLALSETDDLDTELAEYEARVLASPEVVDDEETATRAYRIAVYGFLSELLEMTVRALDR